MRASMDERDRAHMRQRGIARGVGLEVGEVDGAVAIPVHARDHLRADVTRACSTRLADETRDFAHVHPLVVVGCRVTRAAATAAATALAAPREELDEQRRAPGRCHARRGARARERVRRVGRERVLCERRPQQPHRARVRP